MKAVLVSVLALFTGSAISAQAPVAIVTDSPTTALQQLIEQQQWIKETANAIKDIQVATQQARDVNVALQYQIQAVQALSEGSWDGFVEAYNYQTATLAQVNKAFSDFNLYSDEHIQAMLQDPNYKSFAQRLQMLDTYMQHSNAVVRSTDKLGRNIATNLETNQSLVAKSSEGAASLAKNLQIQTQQLGLLAATLADVQQVLAATAALNSAEQQNARILIQQQKLAIENFMKSRGGAGIYDQSDPEAHWNMVTGGDWTTGGN